MRDKSGVMSVRARILDSEFAVTQYQYGGQIADLYQTIH